MHLQRRCDQMVDRGVPSRLAGLVLGEIGHEKNDQKRGNIMYSRNLTITNCSSVRAAA